MAASRTIERMSLHVENVQGPRNLLMLIDALAPAGDVTFSTATAVIQHVQIDYNYTDAKAESVTMALQLGLLERTSAGFQMTSLARLIHTLRPGVREDVLHFLLHTGSHADPQGRGRSWAYRTLCDRLWEAERLILSSAEITQLTDEIMTAAQTAFPNTKGFSFSRKSVNGMRAWLGSLAPPVMSTGQFHRREVCSRELLLLAIGAVAKSDGTQLDTELLLTPDRRKAICRICLLDPPSLDRRLDALLPSFPSLISPGTRTGAYGRFIRLHAFPTVEQIAC